MMVQIPKERGETIKLVESILNQGDSRYNSTENEVILADFLMAGAVYLEERTIPDIKEPRQENRANMKLEVQREEKLLAEELLRLEGFKNEEIFFERSFLGSRPDVFAESSEKVIAVECCSCRVSKIIDFIQEVDEIWVFTRGLPPWEKIKYLKDKMQWFIFKKGHNWNKINEDYNKIKSKDLKQIKSPLD